MIDHVTINVSDVEASKDFYEKAFKPFGYTIAPFSKKGVFYAFDIGNDCFFEISNGEVKTNTHVAFRAKSKEAVEEFYKAALAAGGKDNGKPGLRPNYTPNYYAAFIIDPDGHNIEAVFYT